jgi:hypothetical protein
MLTRLGVVLAGTLLAVAITHAALAQPADSTAAAPPPAATAAPPPAATAAPTTEPPAATPDAQAAPAALTPAATPTAAVATPGVTAAVPPPPGAADTSDDDASTGDGGWPRAIEAPSGALIVLHQPQVLSWEKQRRLVAMAAVEYTPKGGGQPSLGTVRLETPTSTSVEDRMINCQKVEVTSMSFSSLDKTQSREVLEEIRKSLPRENMLVSLDRILAAVDRSTITVKGVDVNTEAPPIFWSQKPAILVQFDTDPIWIPISGTSLSYAVNTNWDVFVDNDTKITYVRNDTYWLSSKDMKKWQEAKKLPPSFDKIPNDGNWAEVKGHIPPGKRKGPVPVVFVSYKPSELILLDGGPDFEEVEGTNLLWVQNTETDLFRMKKDDKEFYVLLSGRWFKSKKPEKGGWSFATTSLPPDFANIPKGHPRSRVLSSVPGTPEASTAILLAQVPRTARVDAKNLKPPDVVYDGEPKFKKIEGTSVSYAENTGSDVLQVGNQYYLCSQGVWFTSPKPGGPWVVTTNVPAEIYKIPSNSPMSHVTYVTVVDDDDDYPVYGYTAGYMGMTIAFGCAMWGGGWYYPPYYHGGIYYPRPVAYGGGVAYNPWTGAYGGYQAAYGPYGGVARGASYNPSTGTYKRGAVAWGPTGANGYMQAYNPRTGTYAGTRQGSNVYGSWGSSHVQRGDDWVKTQRTTDRNGNTKWQAQGSGGGSYKGWKTDNRQGFVGTKGDDVYAGRDGNVYKKGDNGWQQWDKGNGWSDVQGGGNRPSQQPSGGRGDRPSAGTQPSTGDRSRPSAGTQPSTGQLDRDAQARQQGSRQTRDYGNYQRGGGQSSYGGGSRGGGGMRGGGGGRRR